ncbi:tyrosine-type recombinase/integrase [Bosea sp. (in: a-proteobacteria)]|uniref:tyrosine-type recombinase/integrase n=1 Tax=Bosea sp. (in: a-proteobacteria) TaxID=1871050 RepID=UPI001AD25C59|nr:tyrosine-type recombinase/integrase [Bosea sp. (in: a-proteobacteria)]MBN9441418.1 tyrosine-type recombinase/integrase [Bosea sp. (in: a-proteobacteria)]
MASKSRDTSFLEWHGGRWRVVIAVPRELHHRLGSKLKQSLRTDSLSQANRVKGPVIKALRAKIEHARSEILAKSDSQMEKARKLRDSRHDHPSPENVAAIMEIVEEETDRILGRPLTYIDADEDDSFWPPKIPVYDPRNIALADEFRAVVLSNGTPIDRHHKEYMATLTVSFRTRADDNRALQYLMEWCAKEGIRPVVEELRPKHAAKFALEMGPKPERSGEDAYVDRLEPGTNLDAITRKKYVTRLSAYWEYLRVREIAEVNIWLGCKIPVRKKPDYVKERPFTNDEIRRMLMANPTPQMRDLIMIGALTGARLDAIVDLKVDSILDGAFEFKPQKQETDHRHVPIHPDLMEIVLRRTKGKEPSDDFFPEWPPVKKEDSMRERSFKASNQFTEFRRSCGVDDRHIRIKRASDGSMQYDPRTPATVTEKARILQLRRSRVNFHSFRRWFSTRLEQAYVPGTLISAIVGHEREGTTLSIYSDGPEFQQATDAIKKLSLPPLTDEPAVEPRTLKRRR